ncbi:IclR family transcriptional regulator [Leucobacter denitrificans]|uniref:Glycerol operon regulatory protein n=1 Tax=Leucobacter denitrificans TaxID=683042 RepID=A0A7G9S266_9MICO|nr:IclR family transcriptional regulator [Leucobacter denitrificans]QNN61941.1 IclR family transcriptional regulator [Leucobacter denitrificans]
MSAESSQAGQVQSVVRAFALLEVLAQADGELTLAEIADRADLAQPTTHRLLRTLLDLGHVRQLENRQYALGPGLMRLGERATPRLAERARPVLVRLEDVAQETANLAVLDGDLVTYIAQVPSRHHMRMFTEVGRRVLPHASGVGKAMLSTLSEVRVRDLTERTGMPGYTATTHTTADSLVVDLRDARRRGFAIDDGEQEVGVRCIAVAIPGSTPPAAVSISGPSARITDAIVETAVTELTRAAAELAAV